MSFSGKNSIKIQIASDFHTEFVCVDDYLGKIDAGADIALVVGDVDNAYDVVDTTCSLFKKSTIKGFVLGNHEFYGVDHNMDDIIDIVKVNAEKKRQSGNQIFVLENDVVFVPVGDVVVRIIGATLWTDYNLYYSQFASRMVAYRGMFDFRAIHDSAMVERLAKEASLGDVDDTSIAMKATEIFLNRFNRSAKFIEGVLDQKHDGPTIVMTHHLPSFSCVAPHFEKSILNPAFASNLDHLLAKGASLWAFGHTHSSVLRRYRGGTLLVCNPAGYPTDRGRENVDFDPSLIVDISQSDNGEWVASLPSAFG